MDILIIDMHGCKNFELGYQIKTNLEKLGHSVSSFNYRLKRLQKFPFTNALLNDMMVRASKKKDLVIVNKGESIMPGTVNKIASGSRIVNWNPDEPFGKLLPFNNIRNISEYDAFFTYDKQYLDGLLEINPNSFHLPPGADIDGVHKEQVPLKDREYKYDVCFIGTAYPNRVKLMDEIKGKVCLAGHGWSSFKDKATVFPHVDIPTMSRLYNESKIVLNHYGESKYFIVPNPRTFEIPATRSFQLTNMPREASDYFKPDEEIVTYESISEFKELVDKYLSDDNARERIADKGFNRVKEEHTMMHRIKSLLKTVENL